MGGSLSSVQFVRVDTEELIGVRDDAVAGVALVGTDVLFHFFLPLADIAIIASGADSFKPTGPSSHMLRQVSKSSRLLDFGGRSYRPVTYLADTSQ
jgi:hypothetical protein